AQILFVTRPEMAHEDAHRIMALSRRLDLQAHQERGTLRLLDRRHPLPFHSFHSLFVGNLAVPGLANKRSIARRASGGRQEILSRVRIYPLFIATFERSL